MALDIIRDRDTVFRRVESVRFLEGAVRERRLSLDISMDDVRRHFDDQGQAYGRTALVPLLFQPKGLIFDLDFSVDGRPAAAPLRFINAVITGDLLVALGERETQSAAPTSVREMLRQLCAEFPDGASTAAAVSTAGAAKTFAGPSKSLVVNPDARRWFRRAARSLSWCAMIDRAAENYLVLAELPMRVAHCSVKLRRVESGPDPRDRGGPVINIRPFHQVVVRFDGTGRALSEHYRVLAPPGTFFSGRFLLPPQEPATLKFTDQDAPDRLVIYSNSFSDEGLIVAATVGPYTRDFALPALIVTLVMFAALAIGALSEWYHGELERVSGSVESIAAIGLFAPSAALAYLMRPEDHDIRWRTLRVFRRLAGWAFLPFLSAVGMLLPERSDWRPGILKWYWTGMAAVDGVLAAVMIFYVHRIASAFRIARERDGVRREWAFVSSGQDVGR